MIPNNILYFLLFEAPWWDMNTPFSQDRTGLLSDVMVTNGWTELNNKD